MKKKLSIIFFLIFALISCNQGNPQDSGEFSSKSDNDISSASIEEKEAQIEIEYYFNDGQFYNRIKTKGTIGKTYKYTSPDINFMKPDVDEVEFELTEEGYYQKVIYDYSYEPISEVTNGTRFNYLMADEEKGLSFNYVISGNNSHWNEIFTNEYFILYNSYLRAIDIDYYADFKSGSAIKSNNSVNDALLTGEDNEVFVSISINPDYSIDFYKNGILTYTFLPGMLPDNIEKEGNNVGEVKIRTLVDNIFYGISDSGFSVAEGDFNITNLSINYALDEQKARELYRSYVHTKVLYVDEFGNEILEGKSIIDLGGTSYTFLSPKLDNFSYDKSSVNGVTSKSKTEKVVYTFQASEQITQEVKNNKANILNQKNILDWANSSMWYRIVSEIEGDFIIRLNYHLNGAASMSGSTNSEECKWRTNLTIIHDPNTNDRMVSRLDCYGWLNDENRDGKNIGTNLFVGNEYLDNPHLDSYNVYNDCEVTQTIKRVGARIEMDYIIKPNKVGYENRVYTKTVTLDNVTIRKLNISFSAEDAKIEINSLKIRQL